MPHVISGYSLYLGPFHSHQSWSLGNFAIHSEFGSLEIQDLIWSSLKTPDSPPWIMNRDERKKCKNLGRPLANRRGPSAASTTGRLQWSKLPWWKLASVLMAGRAPFVPFVPICHDWRFQLRWAVQNQIFVKKSKALVRNKRLQKSRSEGSTRFEGSNFGWSLVTYWWQAPGFPGSTITRHSSPVPLSLHLRNISLRIQKSSLPMTATKLTSKNWDTMIPSEFHAFWITAPSTAAKNETHVGWSLSHYYRYIYIYTHFTITRYYTHFHTYNMYMYYIRIFVSSAYLHVLYSHV